MFGGRPLVAAYNPDQPRDDAGRFTSDGGASSGRRSPSKAKEKAPARRADKAAASKSKPAAKPSSRAKAPPKSTGPKPVEKELKDDSGLHDKGKQHIESLPPETQETIKRYSGSLFEKINTQMRSCPGDHKCLSAENRAHADRIEAAIDSHGKFEEPILVNRAIRIPPKDARTLLASMKRGREVTMPSITSTTTAKRTDFHKGASVNFKITAIKGLPIAGVANVPREREVLLSSRARYRVAKVVGKTIHLVQIS